MSLLVNSAGLSTGLTVTTAQAGAAGVAESIGVLTADYDSVRIGKDVARGMTDSAHGNTYIGTSTAQYTTSGSYNVGIGHKASLVSAGFGNVVVGSSSASGMYGGSGNVILGARSASSLNGGHSNVFVGTGADNVMDDGVGSVAVGASSRASSGAVALGRASTAYGESAVAVGTRASATGDGAFSLANRVRGHFSVENPGSYVVEVDADALKLADGGVLAFCPRRADEPDHPAVESAQPLDQRVSWMLTLEGADLVMRSAGGAVVRFVDDFRAGVLDFTATHTAYWPSAEYVRVAAEGPLAAMNRALGRPALSGLVVVATEGEEERRGEAARAWTDAGDRAVPCGVALCSRPEDPAVLGVTSSCSSSHGAFHVGNVVFQPPPTAGFAAGGPSVAVATSGDVRVWVLCERSRGVRAGDLLTTAGAPAGAARVQASPIRMAWTIGKVLRSVADFAARQNENGCVLIECLLF